MPFKFEKLEVWHEAMDLGEIINKLALELPEYERYNLSSQIPRAADSISLNIAEGSTAATDPEQVRYLNIAIRSLNEVVCCLFKCKRRMYINDEVFEVNYLLLNQLAARLQTFRNRLGGK